MTDTVTREPGPLGPSRSRLCWRCVRGAAAATDRAFPTNTANPDRFLFDRGNEALKENNWLDAREYFRQVVDNYPQSPVRPDAKLGVGDSFLGEKSAESLVLAANEYREFLTFYPRHERADYAQYKLAMSHFQQMRAPERDQTETVNALREFQALLRSIPEQHPDARGAHEMA